MIALGLVLACLALVAASVSHQKGYTEMWSRVAEILAVAAVAFVLIGAVS